MSQIEFEEYINSIIPDDELLQEVKTYAIKNNVPIIRNLAKNILEQIVAIKKPNSVLEIGTAIGYSSIAIYNIMKNYCEPYIITIENDEDRIKEAYKNFKKYDCKINLLEGDAYDHIKNIEDRFDFIFLDGPKAQYINYLPFLLKLLNKDGILFVDNLFQEGRIVKSRYQILRRDRTIHSRVREFIYEITHCYELNTSILPLSDGISISRKVVDD